MQVMRTVKMRHLWHVPVNGGEKKSTEAIVRMAGKVGK